MRVLMVCISDPGDGKKGDTKLVRNRQMTLERMGCTVDILYFEWGLFKSSIKIKTGVGREGVDIVARIGARRIVEWLLSKGRELKGKPIQTWLSFALAGSWDVCLGTIFSSYTSIHFFHIRSVGLWKLAPEKTRVIADLIDSYTLNIGNWIKIEKRWWAKLLLREEYKKIYSMELGIEDYVRNAFKSTVATVATPDLEHIGGSAIRKVVIPVGIELQSLAYRPEECSEIEFRFFGNLDYRPNIDACHVIIDVARELRVRRRDSSIRITVAGRNISRGLKSMLSRQGVTVISPVENMYDLVRSKDVAILPMVSGSGMQSKILEAISWGVLVMATHRTATPLKLVRDEDYIEVETAGDIVEKLLDVANGRFEMDTIRRKAHKRIEVFGWEKTCERLIEEYGR